MPEIDRHLSTDHLESYSMGVSSPEETVRIEEHLLTCESCQERLDDADSYVASMRRAALEMPRDAPNGKGPGWNVPCWFPAFAATACTVMVALVALRVRRSPEPAIAVTLTVQGNKGGGTSAPAHREILLYPDLTGLTKHASYRLELVGGNGSRLWQGKLAGAQDTIVVPGQNPGMYFVRVYLPAGELLREYGLELK